MSYAFLPITFVFRPGGTATGNIYTLWASLYNALKSAGGPKILQVDSSLAPAVVDVGTFDLTNTTLVGGSENLINASVLTLPDGAILFNANGISDQLILETQGTTTPNLTFSSGAAFGAERGSRLNNTGTQPCARLAVNQVLDIAFLEGGSFNSTGAALVDMPLAPATMILVGFTAGNFGGLDNVITGVAGTSLNVVYDAGVEHLPTNPGFAGSTNLSTVDNAQFVGYGPAVPANWLVPPTQVAQALDELAARTSTSNLIWQPGGVTSGNIVATWAEVQTAIATANGAVLVFIDDSMAPATVPVGTTNCENRVVFTAATYNGFGENRLILPDGAILQDVRYFTDGLIVETQGTTQSNLTFASGRVVTVMRGAQIDNTGTEPVVSMGGGDILRIEFVIEGNFSSSGAPLADVGGGSTLTLVALATGTFNGFNNVVTGVAATTLNMFVDAGVGAVPTNPGFGGSSTTTLVDNAQFVAYTPSTPANWNPVPTEVAEALDELAARSGPQEQEFLVSTANIFAALPAVGTMIVEAFGVGGGGGGGGGEGGNAAGATPGAGGGGGGGALPSSQTFTVDLSHQIDVHIGDGGLGGAGGAAATSGLSGADGQTTYIVDVTDNITLASFSGASGGEGGQAPANTGGRGGASMFGQQFLGSTTGFLAAGGGGGNAGLSGFFGQPNQLGCGQPFSGGGPSEGLFSGGPSGLVGAPPNNGGTGGGGGAGVFEGGGAGGGGPVPANSGAGGGGGTGGSSIGGAGSNGALGGSGRIRVEFFPP